MAVISSTKFASLPIAQTRERMPDAHLVTLLQERGAGAIELLYDRHAAAVLGLARRMVCDQGLAEDVVQEVFLSVWRSQHRYQPERGSVRSWVLGITHHRAVDALRRRTSQRRLTAAGQDDADRLPGRDHTEAEAVRRDESRTVRAATELLPGEQRRAIELAYFSGLTHVEIATELDLPLGTVKGRIRLGLEKLRDGLVPAEAAA